MTYTKLREAIQENNLSWSEIDRILLNPENYREVQKNASFELSNYATNNSPAVRQTDGQEKLVYVAENGIEVTIIL